MTDFASFVPLQRFRPTLALSPDGSRVAWAANPEGRHNLWVAPVDGGAEPRRLTDLGDRAVRSVAWSPDGSVIAFEADDRGDEQFQIHVVSAAGGEPRTLTTATDRQHVLGDAPFTPDGRVLAYAGNDRDPMAQDLLLHDLASGEARRVESRPGEMLFPGAASPDGRWLSVGGARSNNDSTCYLLDLRDPGAPLREVTPHDGDEVHRPGPWSADSRSVLVRTDARGEFLAVVRHDVTHLTGDGPGEGDGGPGAADGARADDPGPVAPEVVLSPGWDVEDVTTSADGSTTAWVVNVDGRSELHVSRAGTEVALPDLGPGVVTATTLSADGSLVAFLRAAAERPTDVVVIDVARGTARHLTDSRPPGLTVVEPVRPELVRYPTADGREIPAWFYRPHGAGGSNGAGGTDGSGGSDATGARFPVVLSIHGGPETQERPEYQYSGLYQHLLSRGVGVLAPNVRGSTGYGKTYQGLIHRDWGGAELRDFEHAVRWLRARDDVRADRIAVYGGSYGGFATLSCLSRLPSLWAAGVSIVGPSNLLTLARSVPPTWRPIMTKWIGDPDTEADFLLERSPITYADAITAPLFVVQGAKDPRVVRAESDQIVESLRARGVDVRYDVYPDEGHGFTKRENEQRALSDVSEFLCARLLAP